MREKGFAEHFDPRTVSVHWSEESAALVIDANLRGPQPGKAR